MNFGVANYESPEETPEPSDDEDSNSSDDEDQTRLKHTWIYHQTFDSAEEAQKVIESETDSEEDVPLSVLMTRYPRKNN